MAAPKTVVTYNLNGTTREFDFAFDYLSRSFVQITLIGETRKQLVLGTDFTFVSNTRIRTNLIWGPPSWTLIEIRRVTSTTERLVDFQDASILRAADLNLSELQVLHVAEEAREAATETIGTNNDGNLDARGRRIINVADPVDPGDALNLGTYQGDTNGAYQSKLDAQAARDKAKEWATKTGTVEGTLKSSKGYATDSAASASASQASAQASASSAAASQSSATASQSSASVSTTKASEAGTYASNAQASATAAATSMDTAQKWAVNPENSAVSGGLFSSYHWAMKSKAWADAAATGVLPDGSVTWTKLVEFMKGNMHPDPFVLTLSDWAVSAPVSIASGNASGNGAGLIITIPQTTGTPDAFGGDCCTPRMRVLAGMRLQFVANHITQDTSGSGNVRVHVSWYRRDGSLLASNGIGLARPVSQDFETNLQVVVPVEAHYLRIRWRFTFDNAGALKVSLVAYRQMVLHAGWGEVTDALATRLTNAEGTITSQGATITSQGNTLTSQGTALTAQGNRIAALEAVKPVKYVNWVAPDASGNVNVATAATGVPLDCYGAIGEIAILAPTNASITISTGAVVAGSGLRRYNTSSGNPSGPATQAGTWRFLSSAGTTIWGVYQRIS